MLVLDNLLVPCIIQTSLVRIEINQDYNLSAQPGLEESEKDTAHEFIQNDLFVAGG